MLERAGKQFPDKMFIISEFGTPGVFATDTVEADKLRVHILQQQLDVFENTTGSRGQSSGAIRITGHTGICGPA